MYILRDVMFILFGYLSGSILYARFFGKLLKKRDVTKEGKDQNPGTANAFLHGGFLCGILTLIGDFFKAAIPVFLYLNLVGEKDSLGLILVMLYCIIGHMFPLFFSFKGGKGIASSFGVCAGLFMFSDFYSFAYSAIPFLILAVSFIFFSLVIRINPHIYRTYISYFVASVLMFFFSDITIAIGFAAINACIFIRLLASKEDKSGFGIKVLWMH